MKNFITSLIDNILGNFYGRKAWQPFFGFLHSIAIKGMNLRYNPLGDDGEAWVISMLANYYSNKKIQPVVFDVGANEGDYVHLLTNAFTEGVTIHAFEPAVSTFARLSSRFFSNTSVTLQNVGLGDSEAVLQLYHSEVDSSVSSIYPRDKMVGRKDDFREEITLWTLNNYCQQAHVEKIHFMKIDVEGNEINVLSGASDLLEKISIDFIQFEFGPRNVDSRTYLRDFYTLLSDKYYIYRILKNGLYALTPYSQDYEAFFASNYLAVSRRITDFKS